MRFKGLTRSLAIALEVVGCGVIALGVAIEVTMRAPIGFIAITGGSLAVAFGSIVFAKLLRKQGKS